jgi:hypothetical protein
MIAMARLRVPASPAKARPLTCNKAAGRPDDIGQQLESQDRFHSFSDARPKSNTTGFVKDAVESLASMSRTTKRDIQGYIVGQYKAVEKMSHEHIDPTGTKTVFFLGQEGKQREEEEETELLDEVMKADLRAYVNEEQDADRPWRGVRDFVQKDVVLATAVPAKAKAPSLAQCIASAGVDDADSDLDSDSEDDEIDLNQKIKHAISSFAKKVAEYEDDEHTTTVPPTNDYLGRRPYLLSSLEAIDIPYPGKSKQKFGLRRHSGVRSLAYLITHAGDTSYSPDQNDHSPSRLPFPVSSPSQSSFLSPNAGNWHLSADDALDMLRERFRKTHYAGGGTGCCCREWLDAKFELGCRMVHGPSLLRFVTNCYDNEHNIMLRVRTSPSKDTLNTKSSVQTSLFSKYTSATSMSSYRNSRPQSAHTEDEQRIYSLSIPNPNDWCGEMRMEETAQPHVSVPTSARISEKTSHVTMATSTCDVQLKREETLQFHKDISTGSEYRAEFVPPTLNTSKPSRPKWASRMKHCFHKIPKKTKQTARDCIKATKKYSRTAWTLVPAALSSCHPFQKISSII